MRNKVGFSKRFLLIAPNMFQFLNAWLSFDNSRRLLLGFDSPIDAGILLAVIIPWVRFTTWPLSAFLKKSSVIVSIVCEVALLYLLSWTGSRGPMIALVAACFLQAGLCLWEKRSVLGRLLLLRSLIMTLLLVVFVSMNGFGGRFASAVASTDASVLNRLEIIKSARGLLLLDPLRGCGWGWAGYHYSHWFEPQNIRHLYTGLSNEYLQIGAELGLPMFLLILAGVGAILAAPWVEKKGHDGWRLDISHKAYASCVVLAIVACMTTYHNSPTLAAITIVMFATSCLLTKAWLNRKALLIGFAAGLLLILAMLCIPPQKQSPDVSLRGKQFIELQSTENPDQHENRPLVLVDKNVLGHVYGQSLRLLLPDKPFNGKMLVALPDTGTFQTCPKEIDTCVAFGASINSEACSMLQPLERLIVVHPAMPPPDSLPKAKQTIVILPMIDEAGVNALWKRLCKAQNIPCITTEGTGLDMQSRIGGFFEHVY